MSQLWQMVKQILATVFRLEIKQENMNASQSNFRDRVDVQFATLDAKISEILKVVQTIQSAVMPLPAIGFSFIVEGVEVTQMQMKDNAVLDVSLSAKDVKGNAASLDAGAVPSWAVSDPSLATIEVAADNLSAKVTPVGPLGSFDVQLSIPAINDEPALSGSLPVEVIASAAVEVTLQGAIE